MSESPSPILSVVVSTRAGMRSLAHVWASLRRQTVAAQLEIIVVAPAGVLEADPPDAEGFAAVRAVAIERLDSLAHASAAGARAATAPLVAFTEDHVTLDPGWARALVEAHERGAWAVVGPMVRNADPHSLVGWADFVMGYGPFAEPVTAGRRSFLPGHNSCYRRDVLARNDAALEELLLAETVFHWELDRAGERLALEPRARIAHLNFGRLRPWIVATFLNARLFAGVRSASWPLARRAAFAAAAPMVALVRLGRTMGDGRRVGMPRRALPALVLGLLVDAAGQAVGAAAGLGRSPHAMVDYEYERFRFARRARKRAAPSAAPTAPEAK